MINQIRNILVGAFWNLVENEDGLPGGPINGGVSCIQPSRSEDARFEGTEYLGLFVSRKILKIV
jgi:hypothetical protein